MLELLQQLLATGRKIQVDEDEVVNNIEDQYETVIMVEVVTSDIDGEISTETIIIADSAASSIVEPPFQW